MRPLARITTSAYFTGATAYITASAGDLQGAYVSGISRGSSDESVRPSSVAPI